jgi:hypothetical protein
MKKQPRKNNTEISVSGGASSNVSGDPSALSMPSPALQSAISPPPSWRQTAALILLAWGALGVFAALWRLWTRGSLIVIFSALVVGLGFTLAAVFDHLWRRFGEKH